jgi:hypothetical protein
MSQPINNDWLQIEDQLTEKLSQLTLLLHHFANSEEELPKVVETIRL